MIHGNWKHDNFLWGMMVGFLGLWWLKKKCYSLNLLAYFMGKKKGKKKKTNEDQISPL